MAMTFSYQAYLVKQQKSLSCLRPETNAESKNFRADTQNNQNQQIQAMNHFFFINKTQKN
jgi:hypothetical protein